MEPTYVPPNDQIAQGPPAYFCQERNQNLWKDGLVAAEERRVPLPPNFPPLQSKDEIDIHF